MKNFEQHLRNRFDGREVKVDKNELWANIVPQLESTKKDKKGWFIYLVGIATGVVLLSLYFLIQYNESDNLPQANNITTTKSLQAEVIETTSAFAANATVETNEETASSTDNTLPLLSAKNNTVTNAAQKNKRNESTYTAAPTTLLTTTSKLNNNTFTNTTTVENTSTTTIQNTATAEETLLLNKSAVNNRAASTKRTTSFLNLSTLTFEGFDVSVDYEGKVPEAPTENDFITPQKSAKRFGFGLYTGISKTQNVRKEVEQSAYTYAQLRGSTEDQLQTFHIGVNAVAEIKRNIYIQAGLEYSRISSRLNLEDEKIIIDTTTSEIIRNISLTDTAVIIPDGSIVGEVAQNKNRIDFHVIDIPVMVGYQFGRARWRVGVEAGAFINLSMKKEGQILQQDISVYDIEEDTNDWYKPTVGIRPHLGLVSTYDISDHYQLYFSTGITFNKVFSTDNNPIREEKSMFGVRLGGRYFF